MQPSHSPSENNKFNQEKSSLMQLSSQALPGKKFDQYKAKRHYLNPGSLLQTPTVPASGMMSRPDGKITPQNDNSTGGAVPGREDTSSRVLWGTNISTDNMQ